MPDCLLMYLSVPMGVSFRGNEMIHKLEADVYIAQKIHPARFSMGWPVR